MNLSESAAWVQAIGSIFSILSGFLLVIYKDKCRRDREQEKNIKMIQTMKEYLTEILGRMDEFRQEDRLESALQNPDRREIASLSFLSVGHLTDDMIYVCDMLTEDAIKACRDLEGNTSNDVKKILLIRETIHWMHNTGEEFTKYVLDSCDIDEDTFKSECCSRILDIFKTKDIIVKHLDEIEVIKN